MEKKIERTNNYKIFKKLKGNRDVAPSRVRKIVESINKVGYVTSPVIVNENVVRWEMKRIDLERNYEQLELKVGGRGQDKKPRHRRTKAEIERERDYRVLEVEVKKDIIPTLESYLKVANLNEKEYFNQLIEKDLKDKENDLKSLEGLLKKIRGDR